MIIKRFGPYRDQLLTQKRQSLIKLATSGDKKEMRRVSISAGKRYDEYEFLLKPIYKTKENFVSSVLSLYKSGDPMTLLKFSKSPIKTGFDEKTQFKFISTNFSEIVDPIGGNIRLVERKENKYFVKDKLIIATKDEIVAKYGSDIKSIDLELNYPFLGKVFRVYGTLKQTSSTGGGQDDVLIELKNTNKEFLTSTDKNLYTFTIVSGDYYTNKKFKELIKDYRTERNKIVEINKFGEVLVDSIIRWISKTINPNSLNDKDKKILAKELARLEALYSKYRKDLSVL